MDWRYSDEKDGRRQRKTDWERWKWEKSGENQEVDGRTKRKDLFESGNSDTRNR